MKNNFFITISLCLIIFASCKKNDVTKFHFTNNEITETDTAGNFVGHIQTGDWILKPFNQGDAFDKKVLSDFNNTLNSILKNADDPSSFIPFDLKNYNLNCGVDTFYFNMVAYPNPVLPFGPFQICNLKFKINTNLKIERSLMFYSNKVDARSQEWYTYNDSTIATELGTLGISERDYVLYYIIYTTDGCVFFVKGNIIGCGGNGIVI